MDVAAKDRYYLSAEKVKALGHGSSGSVDLVRVKKMSGGQRLVVRKRCLLNESMDQDARARLYHEVHVLSTLSHPHIVSYFHCCISQAENMCIFME